MVNPCGDAQRLLALKKLITCMRLAAGVSTVQELSLPTLYLFVKEKVAQTYAELLEMLSIAVTIVEKLHIVKGKEVHYNYLPKFLYKEEADYLLNYLKNEIPWRQIKYYKPERGYVITPRLTWVAGFHQDTHYKLKNGVFPNAIPDPLLPLKNLVEEHTGVIYNFILFAQYRDGQDSITYHSDDEMFLGSSPTIASITVGEERLFCLKHKESKEVESFNLGHGDMLVMQENCQKDYMHSVPKTTQQKSPRYSLTFRRALNEYGSSNYYTYN
jgi:alkylated DNA repair dioxygenase AlkB